MFQLMESDRSLCQELKPAWEGQINNEANQIWSRQSG